MFHFIIATISYQINPAQAYVFHVNHSPKFYFPASMDQAARYSVQEGIKIVEVYFATKLTNVLSQVRNCTAHHQTICAVKSHSCARATFQI